LEWLNCSDIWNSYFPVGREGGVVGPVWAASHNFKSKTENVVGAEICEETVESVNESLAMMNVLGKSPHFMQ
jgi:hypothetical protein